jgi:serine/threonine protein kinase
VLNRRYRLDERIATGGMGDVWLATDTVLDRRVAVKVLLPALLADPDFITRFRAEARMMAALRHPGVVQVYDFGQDELDGGGRADYLVMEYVEGEPLSQRIAKRGRLDAAETMSVIAQAAQALHAAHKAGIVHRDVKPGNLLVQPDGTVVLVDFGVARSAAVTSITNTNAVPGTALYMAPEQATGRPVSAATDIYALGAVAYHCVAGRAPFTGNSPLEVAVKHLHEQLPPLPEDVPEPVAAVIVRALAKDPADRYSDAEALARAARASSPAGTGVAGVGAAPAVGGVTTRPVGDDKTATVADLPAQQPDPGGPRWRRRTFVLVGVAVAVTLGTTALAVSLLLPIGDQPAATTPTPSPTEPVITPSVLPSVIPSTVHRPANVAPSAWPTSTVEPSPSVTPTATPSEPTTEPSVEPTTTPSVDPTTEETPSVEPTPPAEPTEQPGGTVDPA